jgi:non-ribosomal peptide synthetase component E (peptide arylation enzyme)
MSLSWEMPLLFRSKPKLAALVYSVTLSTAKKLKQSGHELYAWQYVSTKRITIINNWPRTAVLAVDTKHMYIAW